MNSPHAAVSPNFSHLLALVYNGNPSAAEEIIERLLPGLRAIICRRVNPQDVEDVVQDTATDLLCAIRGRQLHNPEALPYFARKIAIRRCAACISGLVKNRQTEVEIVDEEFAPLRVKPVAEDLCVEKQRQRLAVEALSRLSARDREVLQRFYLREQSPEQICAEMGLTATQFRLTKSRAKEKFGHIGRTMERTGPSRPTDRATVLCA
jgi:RNA polymerase sigma factor (sigma-70 family)